MSKTPEELAIEAAEALAKDTANAAISAAGAQISTAVAEALSGPSLMSPELSKDAQEAVEAVGLIAKLVALIKAIFGKGK